MDKLNDFMVDRRLQPELRGRLRAYFKERRTLTKANRHQALIEQMSPSLRGAVASATCIDWLTKVSWMKSGSIQFLESIALCLKPEVFPPQELISAECFHVVTRGVAVKDLRVHISGSYWGDDMILDNNELRNMDPAQAITYVETYTLEQSSLQTVLESYPSERTRVRSARIWIVFTRRFPE